MTAFQCSGSACDDGDLPGQLLVSLLQIGPPSVPPLVAHAVHPPTGGGGIPVITAVQLAPLVVLSLGFITLLGAALCCGRVIIEEPSKRQEAADERVDLGRPPSGVARYLGSQDMLCMYFISFVIGGASMIFSKVISEFEPEGQSAFWSLLIGGGVGGAVSGPLLGYVADSYGRTYVLVEALAFACFGLPTCAFEHMLGRLIIAHVLSGCFLGVFGICMAVVAERAPRGRRARCLATLFAFNAAGTAASPWMGRALPGNRSAACCAAGVACAMGAFWAAFVQQHPRRQVPHREPKPASEAEDDDDHAVAPQSAPRRGGMEVLASHPAVVVWLLVFGVEAAVGSMQQRNNLLFLEDVVGASTADMRVTAVVGVLALLMSAMMLVEPVVRHLGEALAFVVASGLYAVALVLAAVVRQPQLECVVLILSLVLAAFLEPCVISLVAGRVPHDSLGIVLGFFASLKAAGFVLGRLFGMLCYSASPRLHLTIGAAVQGTCVVAALLVMNTQKSRFALGRASGY